jgi:hypothetical protein
MKKFFLFLALLFTSSAILEATEAEKWNTAKSTHFIVYYENASQDFINRLMDKAEDYYNKIAEDLGFNRYNFWLWDNRAKIYIYDNAKEYQSATGYPGWFAGSALAGEKIIQAYADATGFFDTVLPHEMGHIIFREFVGFYNKAIPLWLEEGVASYQQKLKYSMSDAWVREAIKKNNFMTLGKLGSFNVASNMDSDTARLFYAESFSIVDFLIKEFGRDSFVLFCQNLRDKNNLERALASVYPFSNVKELEQGWERYLEKK